MCHWRKHFKKENEIQQENEVKNESCGEKIEIQQKNINNEIVDNLEKVEKVKLEEVKLEENGEKPNESDSKKEVNEKIDDGFVIIDKMRKRLENKKIRSMQKKNSIDENGKLKFENELATLKLMGFNNEELNLKLLSRFSKLEKVISKLLKLNQ